MILFLCLSIILITSVTPLAYADNAPELPVTALGNNFNASFDVGDPTWNLKYTTKNDDLLGPEAIIVKNQGGFYLLDTSGNKVISIEPNGSIADEFTFDDLTVTKISTDSNDNLFVLDAAKGVIQKNDAKKTTARFTLKSQDIEPLIDFGCINENTVYFVTADAQGGKTRCYNLNNGKASLVSERVGRIAANGVNYKTVLIKDPGADIGHACKITIFDSSGQTVKDINLKSNHWIEGAEYLGEDGDNYILKVHEIESDQNNNTWFEDLIEKVDANGNVVAVSVLPKQVKYAQNSTAVKNGSVYHLNNQSSSIKIEKVEFTAAAQYKSSLDAVNTTAVSPSTESTNSSVSGGVQALSLAYVNRSLIQSTAVSYWSCYWYCSYPNYWTYQNSTRPRYITAPAQNYQSVPYNWGGWDALSGFNSKLSSGTTAGNINTSYSYSNLAGVDCSGYVQRCWGINDYKRSTTDLDSSSISFRISASSLKFGDAWNRSDHIMVYHQRDGYGNYVLYEATQLNSYDRTAHTIRTASSVEGSYHSIRRVNITEDV